MLALRTIYQNVGHTSVRFTNKSPDNFALIVHKNVKIPILITNVSDDNQLVHGYIMHFTDDLYKYPYVSSTLIIGYYKVTDTYVQNLKPVNKCIAFTTSKENNFIIIPYVNFISYS